MSINPPQTFELSETPGTHRQAFSRRAVVSDRSNHEMPCSEIDEDVIIFFGFIMQIIAADAEIERPAEIRCQPEFLAQLPGMFI